MPSALVDGSPAHPPPVELEGVEGPTVVTRLRILRSSSLELRSRETRCVGVRDVVVVERVGVSGVSVTFVVPERREAYACDATTAAVVGSAWCGHAYAQLYSRRLRDPRLSLSCRSTDDVPVGFAWLQPAAAASYVVVARPGYNEAYRVGAHLPVRVVTEDVDLRRASAAFSVSEHARDGRLLRRYVLEAFVSG